MLGRILLLHLLLASALAYNQELLSCLKAIGNDDLSDVVDVIANCTIELGEATGMTCNDFQLKIELDHCVFKGMGWTNEDESEIDFYQWELDTERIMNGLNITGYGTTKDYEKFDDCKCQTKEELMEDGKLCAGKVADDDLHCPGPDCPWHLSAVSRCGMNRMKKACKITTEGKYKW